MDSDYVEQLEKENEELRQEVIRAHDLLEDAWSDSKTMGLVPHKHFIPLSESLDQHMIRNCRVTKFTSLRAARDSIKANYNNGNKVYIRMHKTEDGKECVYDRKVYDDDQGNPMVSYFIHQVVIG